MNHQLLVPMMLSLFAWWSWLLLIRLTPVANCQSSITWEASNDPDFLCANADGSSKITGYKATLDCRGYVYCSDGYLMGGGAAGINHNSSSSSDAVSSASSPSDSTTSNNTSGVIACWPNQLFDESLGICTYWQNVNTSKCTEFDPSKMMPELTDENANEERFFCGVSASNAKSVCEPCPGGSRLECSDITHNCFAGITGCSSKVDGSNGVNLSPSTIAPEPSPITDAAMNPTTLVSPSPITSSLVNNFVDNEGESSGSWDSLLPSLAPSYYLNAGGTSIPSTSINVASSSAGPTPMLVVFPTTMRPTYPPVKEDDPTKRFCGYDWDYVIENCLTAIPCPGGYATGVCPIGMNCIAETPCTDQTYLNWLLNNQINNENSEGEVTNSPPDLTQCSSSEECPLGMFCHQQDGLNGVCGECQSNGMGCAVEEFCLTSGCQSEQGFGISKCYTWEELNQQCAGKLNDETAQCDIESMTCEIQTVTIEQDVSSEWQSTITITNSSSQSTSTTMTNSSASSDAVVPTQQTNNTMVPSTDAVLGMGYRNPSGNTYFCGVTYEEVSGNCLASKPCPSSIASDFCAEHEGCFSSPTCANEYDSIIVMSSPSPTSSYPSTQNSIAPTINDFHSLTKPLALTALTLQPSVDTDLLLAQSQSPALQSDVNELLTQTIQPTVTSINALHSYSPTSSPSRVPTVNTSFCGTSYEDHVQNCDISKPCPRGDECGLGESCFASSPCATSFGGENANVESGLGNFCGLDWNTMVASCNIATKCPRGDECATGEFCYRDFACDPPLNLTNLSTSSTVTAATNDADGENGALTSDAYGNPLAGGQGIPSEFCSLCDSDGQLARTEPVTYDGNSISCGEFGWVFLSKNIAAGSEECLDIRAEFDGTCCNTKHSGNTCDLCNTDVENPWYDIQFNKSIQFEGKSISCTELSELISARFEIASDQCLSVAEQYFDNCCFEKCSLCGDADLLWESTVFYSGVELSCHELDEKVFVEKGIASGTQTCTTSQESYAGFCCLQALDEPCDICTMNGVSFQLIEDMEVNFEGKARTCLEVHSSLHSRREQASELCINAQGQLFDQCCNDVHIREPVSDSTKFSVTRSPTMALPSPKPTEQFESWYTGALSSKSVTLVSNSLCIVPVALVILTLHVT